MQNNTKKMNRQRRTRIRSTARLSRRRRASSESSSSSSDRSTNESFRDDNQPAVFDFTDPLPDSRNNIMPPPPPRPFPPIVLSPVAPLLPLPPIPLSSVAQIQPEAFAGLVANKTEAVSHNITTDNSAILNRKRKAPEKASLTEDPQQDTNPQLQAEVEEDSFSDAFYETGHDDDEDYDAPPCDVIQDGLFAASTSMSPLNDFPEETSPWKLPAIVHPPVTSLLPLCLPNHLVPVAQIQPGDLALLLANKTENASESSTANSPILNCKRKAPKKVAPNEDPQRDTNPQLQPKVKDDDRSEAF